MLRCALAVLALSAVAPSVHAQSHRNFPANALRGELVVGAPPEALLNGQPARLAPGARIRGENNLVTTPGSLSGRKFIVHYTREATTGLLFDVWVLTAAELARRPWPVTDAEARTWSFDPVGQTWSKP